MLAAIDINEHQKARQRSQVDRLQGLLALTKTDPGFTDALVLRDLSLETVANLWVQSRTTQETLIQRYFKYDPRLDTAPLRHFAGRILCGKGNMVSGRNIFVVFPLAESRLAADPGEIYGYEFIDVWSNIFRQVVLPLSRRHFGPQMRLKINQLEARLDEVIYLASVYHELGHRTGPYAVPPFGPGKKALSKFTFEVMSELATDTILTVLLKEFEELGTFVLLQRLFWFGRIGFSADTKHGQTNVDNDCWIGSFLWQRALTGGLISESNGRYDLGSQSMLEFFQGVLTEIDELAEPDLNEAQFQAWMKDSVPQENGRFVIPQSFARLLEQSVDIPEVPAFSPPFSYDIIDDLQR